MLIQDLANAGSTPVLSEMLRFSGARQRVLAHNIANADTPDFRPNDVSVAGFRRALSEAVDKRRASGGAEAGVLNRTESREVVRYGDDMMLRPRTSRGGMLYHDRNNRDIERMMQDLTENATMYKTVTDFLRRQSDVLRVAITQRP